MLDPACGGGTFLVRAYVRKRELAANRKHRDLLSDIYGVDVSQFAAHLTQGCAVLYALSGLEVGSGIPAGENV